MGGCPIFREKSLRRCKVQRYKRYEGVGGGQISRKNLYVTLEWHLASYDTECEQRPAHILGSLTLAANNYWGNFCHQCLGKLISEGKSHAHEPLSNRRITNTHLGQSHDSRQRPCDRPPQRHVTKWLVTTLNEPVITVESMLLCNLILNFKRRTFEVARS